MGRDRTVEDWRCRGARRRPRGHDPVLRADWPAAEAAPDRRRLPCVRTRRPQSAHVDPQRAAVRLPPARDRRLPARPRVRRRAVPRRARGSPAAARRGRSRDRGADRDAPGHARHAAIVGRRAGAHAGGPACAAARTARAVYSSEPMNRFRFGAYVIDTDARVLSRDGARVPLQAQPFELLRLLVERPGELVTREEIRARLWPDRVVAYDLSINYAVRQIRAALDEDAATILQTVPRRGYRFIAPVARVGVPAATRPGLARIDYRHLSAAAALVAAFASGF